MIHKFKSIFFKSIPVVITLIAFSCKNESSSTESGNIKLDISIENGANKKAFVQLLKPNEVVTKDTILLDDKGNAMVNFNGEEISFYSLTFPDNKGDIRFVANAGDEIKLSSNYESLFESLKLEGTRSLELLTEFHDLLINYNSYIDSLKSEYNSLKSQNMHHTVENEFNELYRTRSLSMQDKIKSFVSQNKGEFITILAVRSLNPDENSDLYNEVKNNLVEKFPESSYVQHFSNELDKILALSIGGAAPDFTLPSFEGKEVQLSDFNGKYVLIDFWATWCKPCIAEIPYLKEAQQRYKEEGLEVLSVCIDREESKERWKKIIESKDANWTQLFDDSGETANSYDIKAFPTLILLDKEGKVMASSISKKDNFRREGMLKKLEELIK